MAQVAVLVRQMAREWDARQIFVVGLGNNRIEVSSVLK
jgi:hypothetical protein